MLAFVNVSIDKQLSKDCFPLVNYTVVECSRASSNVLKGPSARLCGERFGIAKVLSSVIASFVAHKASMTDLAFTMLAELFRRALPTVPLLLSVRALTCLTSLFTI